MDMHFLKSDPRFKLFLGYFMGEEDQDFQKLFICKYNGWLSEQEYTRYIENATDEEIELINRRRLQFFLNFFESSVVLDKREKRFFRPTSIDEYKNYCINGLDDNSDFLIIDYVNWVAINTSFDFTDVCYFIESSNVSSVTTAAKNSKLYVFEGGS